MTNIIINQKRVISATFMAAILVFSAVASAYLLNQPKPAFALPFGFVATPFPAPPGTSSHGVAVDKNGIVWWTDFTVPGGIVRQDPSLGPGLGVTVHSLAGTGHVGPITNRIDSAGDVWFGTSDNFIGKLDATLLTFSFFGPIPEPGCFPDQVATDAAGDVWFDCLGTDKIGRLNVAAGTFDIFVTPTALSGPSGITVDSSIVWSIERATDNVVRLDPALAVPTTSNGITEFPIPTPPSNPETVKVCGNRVWFTELAILVVLPAVAQIGFLDKVTNTITEFAVDPIGGSTYGLVVDGDGNPWTTNSLFPRIYGFDVTTNTPAIFPTPTVPHHIDLSPAGELWYTDFNAQIVRLTPVDAQGNVVPLRPTCEPLGDRMTGGGRITDPAVGKVTHGFELHCDASQSPNNLEVNWGGGNKFHLTSLTTAICSDDPNISEVPPVAGFDSYKGTGTGRLNGVAGATATWKFTDAGEPGKNDLFEIEIKDASNVVVLNVSANLKVGNHQAH